MRLVAVVLVLGACRGSANEGAPCAAVANRVYVVAREDLAKATVDPTTRRAVADQLPAMRDSLTQICADGKWSTQVRNCMVSAGDHLALQTCQQQLTDEQRRGLDRASTGETTSH